MFNKFRYISLRVIIKPINMDPSTIINSVIALRAVNNLSYEKGFQEINIQIIITNVGVIVIKSPIECKTTTNK